MKFITLLIFCLIQCNSAWAKDALIPTNISHVISTQEKDETYRSLVLTTSEEGETLLGIEKYKIGEFGNPDKILFQKKISIPSIKGFKPYIDKIYKKSVEATYGCCSPKNLRWSKNKEIMFDIEFQDRFYKRDSIQRNGKKVNTSQYSHKEISYFNCKSSSLKKPKFNIKCSFDKMKKIIGKEQL